MSKTVKVKEVEKVKLSKRGLKQVKKSKNELERTAESGSLSAASARFELQRRAGLFQATNL